MNIETLDRAVRDGVRAGRSTPSRVGMSPAIKRALDMVASFVLIVTILPVFLVVTITIAATGQTPFYSHARVGRRGREFGCIKFRSMHRNADVMLEEILRRDPAAAVEWAANRKLQNDPRITRVGRFLRATSLDELPQLFNILAGQMSLVGPRPVTRAELDDFYGVKGAAAYVSVRPGLTGLWQVSGRSETNYRRRVALDTLYVQRISLRTDLVILVKTVDVVLRQKGAW